MTNQRHFRFRTDAGAVDGTPTWGADEDINFTPGASPFRLRFSIENPDAEAAGSQPFQIYMSKNGGAYAAITAASTNGVKSADAGSDADNTNIYIPRLTTPVWEPLAGAAIDLDFAARRYYSSSALNDIDPLSVLSISRASDGYAQRADGTLQYFTSNQLRVTDLGLLVEDSRQNKLLQSEDFATTWGVVNTTVTTNQAVAMNGTTTMDQIFDGVVATSRHIIYQLVRSLSANTNKTFSIFVKDVDRRYIQLTILSETANGIYAYFDLQTGTVTASGVVASGVAVASASIEICSAGIYRLALVGNPHASATDYYFQVALSDRGTHSAPLDDGVPQYTGTNKSVYVWGAQLEDNVSFPSSYIPTGAASATRAADNVTIIGAAQTDIAAATASIISQVNRGMTGIATNIVDSDGTNLVGFNASDNGLASLVATLTTGNSANRTTQDKLGIAWNASGRSLVLNGGTVATDATAQTPSSTQHIGSSGAVNFANAYIERLTVWTSRLADATLQGFTS